MRRRGPYDDYGRPYVQVQNIDMADMDHLLNGAATACLLSFVALTLIVIVTV